MSISQGPNPQFPVDLFTFTEKILNGKLYFLCSDNFKIANMHLQKMLLKKNKPYFEEELGKNRNKLK